MRKYFNEARYPSTDIIFTYQLVLDFYLNILIVLKTC